MGGTLLSHKYSLVSLYAPQGKMEVSFSQREAFNHKSISIAIQSFLRTSLEGSVPVDKIESKQPLGQECSKKDHWNQIGTLYSLVQEIKFTLEIMIKEAKRKDLTFSLLGLD